MALTVEQLADDLGVEPGDIRVLMARYGGDVPMWEEPGVVAAEAGHNISLMLAPTRPSEHA